MKYTDIYQTLEDRQNYDDVEEHGPYFCCARDANGIPKNGVKEPWLGEGYYFWDTRIADARCESGKTKCARFEKRNVQKSGKTKRSKNFAHTTL